MRGATVYHLVLFGGGKVREEDGASAGHAHRAQKADPPFCAATRFQEKSDSLLATTRRSIGSWAQQRCRSHHSSGQPARPDVKRQQAATLLQAEAGAEAGRHHFNLRLRRTPGKQAALPCWNT